MKVSFIVKQSTPPAPQSLLVERTNETYWTPEVGKGSWNTDEWVAEDQIGSYELNLDSIGIDWAGFRPTYVKITFTQTIDELAIIDENSNYICSGFSINSGELYPINFLSDDISKLVLTSSEAFAVQKIEFYVPQNIWVERTSSTYWTALEGTWMATHWTANEVGPGVWHLQLIRTLSGWVEDFRPTKVRVTYTVAGIEDSLLTDENDNFIMQATPLASTTEYIITYADPYNIKEFNMYNYTAGVSFEVQKIEFYI